MKHSSIVGGSTAKRVINCPGSVALCAKMPPKPSSKYADEGTLLHNVISEYLMKDSVPLQSFVGTTYEDQTLTMDLMEDKLQVALSLLDHIDPNQTMEFDVEQRVGFGDFIPDVFGSTDLIGRIGDKAVVLDWKFGDGVVVEAEENPQLLFYAAAAMETEATKWAFAGVQEIECVIIQPPMIKRWTTTPERVQIFKYQLRDAVKAAEKPNAKLQHGDHCRFCAAKPICPRMTGAVDRAIKTQLDNLDTDTIGRYMKNADLLEQWIADLRALAHQILDNGVAVPGYKLVAKRASRKWIDEKQAAEALHSAGLDRTELYKEELISPAQAEKVLKKRKMELPDDLVVAISSGNTVALEDDPRPAVVQIGQQLTAALSKLV